MRYGVISIPESNIYGTTSETKQNEKGTVSSITDQALYGMTCVILSQDNEWTRVITFYGYEGYVHSKDITEISEAELERYLHSDLRIVEAKCLDVMNLPTVTGIGYISLPGTSIIEVIAEEETYDGWSKVRLLDGREGYVTSVHLAAKRFDEAFLYEDTDKTLKILEEASLRAKTTEGGADKFSLKEVLDKWYDGSEETFRKELVSESMKYLGVQYRWAGRSTHGLDCSGLVSITYLRCGITIFRDAAIVNGFPMKKLELNWTDGQFDLMNLEGDKMRPGDALYFPGHIAMYIGEGRYIHSTGRKGDNGVVINSLSPADPLFRKDLLERLYAVAGVR